MKDENRVSLRPSAFMQQEVVERLLALNWDFYCQSAATFARSRTRPQPGFHRLLDELPKPCQWLLDVGCADGRLGRFLLARRAIAQYTGVDFSPELLEAAKTSTVGDFYQRDLSRPGSLTDLGRFQAVACLATLQHLPGRANRLALLQEMKGHLAVGGRLMLSNWQFQDSPRQQSKLLDWSTAGLTTDQVEAHDYLIAWRRGRFAARYVALIDEAETAALAEQAGLTLISTFRSDGQEGNLNLYTVLSL